MTSYFQNNYDAFKQHILQLIASGYSISVGSGPNMNVSMHNNNPLSWQKITNESAGHIMNFKSFDVNGDIIVSSYGKDYIIPKEYF